MGLSEPVCNAFCPRLPAYKLLTVVETGAPAWPSVISFGLRALASTSEEVIHEIRSDVTPIIKHQDPVEHLEPLRVRVF